MKNRCDLCKNYVYQTPTLSDPSYDEYCKLYGNFSIECECDGFELSKYGQIKLNKEREKKLERFIYGKNRLGQME